MMKLRINPLVVTDLKDIRSFIAEDNVEKAVETVDEIYGKFENIQLFRGFDSVFAMPHSRHTENKRNDILEVPEISILADSEESGPSILMARNGREIFITGHMEYNPDTLDAEYKRDLGKRDDVELPKNYYTDNDPEKGPLVTWRAHANLFYHNWINYYIYQRTPYDINKISFDMSY